LQVLLKVILSQQYQLCVIGANIHRWQILALLIQNLGQFVLIVALGESLATTLETFCVNGKGLKILMWIDSLLLAN
jgi:hypothetical protein